MLRRRLVCGTAIRAGSRERALTQRSVRLKKGTANKLSYFYCPIPPLLTTWSAVTDHAVCTWFGDTRSGALSLTEIRERDKGDLDPLFFLSIEIIRKAGNVQRVSLLRCRVSVTL
jgi:hypothetical protein